MEMSYNIVSQCNINFYSAFYSYVLINLSLFNNQTSFQKLWFDSVLILLKIGEELDKLLEMFQLEIYLEAN
jgi:hypothetical protein